MAASTCSLGLRVEVNPDVMPIVHKTVVAMEWAELDDAMQMVIDRLLKSGRLLEIQMVGGRAVVNLRPFAELVLRDARDVAVAKLDSATKSKRIERMLNLAGY